MPKSLIYREDAITAIGGTITYQTADYVDEYILSSTGTVALGGSWTIAPDVDPAEGVVYYIRYQASATLGAFTISIFGTSLTAVQALKNQYITVRRQSGGYNVQVEPDFEESGLVETDDVADKAITPAKQSDLTRGSILLGDATNRPAAKDFKTNLAIPIGDGTDLQSYIVDVAASTILTSISGGKILLLVRAGSLVNVDFAAAAAIARTKLASGTASHVIINDGAGVFSSEAQLATVRGGTGQDSSASTGFPKLAAGVWSFSALTDTAQIKVSFETGYVGDFKMRMGFTGTVTGFYAFLDKALGAADGTITPKNNAGTTMTGSVITFTASDPKGTALTSTPSGNNTFIAGDILTFTTAGGSAAGVAQVSFDFTRTA